MFNVTVFDFFGRAETGIRPALVGFLTVLTTAVVLSVTLYLPSCFALKTSTELLFSDSAGPSISLTFLVRIDAALCSLPLSN